MHLLHSQKFSRQLEDVYCERLVLINIEFSEEQMLIFVACIYDE